MRVTNNQWDKTNALRTVTPHCTAFYIPKGKVSIHNMQIYTQTRSRAIWVWMCHPVTRQIISYLVVLAHNYILCIKQLIVLLVADIVAAVQWLLTEEKQTGRVQQ